MHLDELKKKQADLKQDHRILDIRLKYEKNHMSSENIKVQRRRRAKLNKEIKEYEIKIQQLE